MNTHTTNIALGYISDGDTFRVLYGEEEMILRIVRDDYRDDNPRDWECNLGKMVCFHRRYDLGDKHNYSEPRDFLRDMVQQYIPQQLLLKKLRRGETNCKLVYDRSAREYDLMSPCGWYESEMVRIESFYKDELEKEVFLDYLIPELSMEVMYELLDECDNLVYMPLYLYDHGGITMSVSSFSCPWDSGQVGWIWVDGEKYTEITGKSIGNGWKEDARKQLVSEVILYDHFLQGNSYGWKLFESDDEDCEYEVDSCWGFAWKLPRFDPHSQNVRTSARNELYFPWRLR